MPPLDLRSFSKRLTKVALDFGEKVSRQPLVQITNLRIRAFVASRPWPDPEQEHGTSLELVRERAQMARGHLMAEHIAGVVQKRLTRLSRTKDFASAKDPVEALHDFRVASRRLSAFVDVFEPMLDPGLALRAKSPLRRITRAARDLRDWDVQLGLIRERLSRASTEIEMVALEDLIATTVDLRKREARRVHKQLRKFDFEEVNFALCATLGAIIGHLPAPGPDTGRFLFERLDPFTRDILIEPPLGENLELGSFLHQLRIRFKRLRYALELFEPMLRPAFDSLYSPVEAMQELLGQHHDLVVLDGLVERQRRQLERSRRATLSRAFAALQLQLADERRGLVGQFRNDEFNPSSWRRALQSQLQASRS
jgi:CHAD domain-containing protein